MFNFDFHYLEIRSSRKTDLYKLGFSKADVRGEYERNGRFRKTIYVVSVHSADVAELEAKAAQAQNAGLRTIIRFHAAD